MHRYLFGPVTAEFAREHLEAPRQSGRCLDWAGEPGLDLVFRAEDSWAAFQARWPGGWQPEALVLYLPYTTLPQAAWAAPVPILGLAPDWNLCWHAYRQLLPLCDLVLTDSQGVEVLGREGITQEEFPVDPSRVEQSGERECGRVALAGLAGREQRSYQGPWRLCPSDSGSQSRPGAATPGHSGRADIAAGSPAIPG